MISAAYHDLLLVDRGLGVVALHEEQPVGHHLGIGVGDVDLARRHLGRLVRVGWAAKAPPVAHPAPLAVGLVGLVARPLGSEVILEALGRQQQPPFPRARDRIGILPPLPLELAVGLAGPPLAPLHPRDDPLGIKRILPFAFGLRLALVIDLLPAGIAPELLAGAAEELPAALRGAQPLGQLITPRLAQLLILSLVCGLDLLNNLDRDLPKLLAALPAGVSRDPSAIDRHHPTIHQPGLSAQPQHPAKQSRQRRLMTANEPRDRHMIRDQVARDHPVGHVLTTVTLDRP